MTPKSLGIWIKTEWIQWLNWRCLGWTEQRAVKIWPILWYPGHAGCSVTLIWAGRTGQLWIWKRHLTQLSQKLKEFSSKEKSVFWSSLQFLVSWLSSLLVRLFLDIFGIKIIKTFDDFSSMAVSTLGLKYTILSNFSRFLVHSLKNQPVMFRLNFHA